LPFDDENQDNKVTNTFDEFNKLVTADMNNSSNNNIDLSPETMKMMRANTVKNIVGGKGGTTAEEKMIENMIAQTTGKIQSDDVEEEDLIAGKISNMDFSNNNEYVTNFNISVYDDEIEFVNENDKVDPVEILAKMFNVRLSEFDTSDRIKKQQSMGTDLSNVVRTSIDDYGSRKTIKESIYHKIKR
jgi:hypothetical protein